MPPRAAPPPLASFAASIPLPFRRPRARALCTPPVVARYGEDRGRAAPRPHSSPPGTLRPKQSLGQNFLRDATMAARIVDAFADARDDACPAARVVEVGPGTGALTGLLLERFADMRALEIDQRAVAVLSEEFPSLDVVHADVLQTDWRAVSRARGAEGGEGVAVIGNLPYNIVSQIMFSLMEAPAGAVHLAVVMMQKEVADRVTARTRTKAYGILSVICQLYARPTVLFPVPPSCFTPRPKVDSAMVRFDFQAHEELDVFNTTLTGGLRLVVRAAFNQRRKTLRNSLKVLCDEKGVELPERWTGKRAEELPPVEFLELTRFVFAKDLQTPVLVDRESADARPDSVWRPAVTADNIDTAAR